MLASLAAAFLSLSIQAQGPDAGSRPPPPAARAAQVPVSKGTVMTAEVKTLVDRMQTFYEKTQDFTAKFRQDYTYKTFKRTQRSSGQVTFKKPALMRWEYLLPSARTFVLAGEKVYAYDPEAMTLTLASVSSNELSASVTFLWGRGKLSDEFAITEGACLKCLGTVLVLEPLKPDPRFQRILLEVDPKSAQVVRSTVIDPDGSENAITFSELKINTGVDQKQFKLAPPEGTQVMDFTRPLAAGPAGDAGMRTDGGTRGR